MTITTEQIPPDFHQGMSEEMVSAKLADYIVNHLHMGFVLPLLRKTKAASVDWLVGLACDSSKAPCDVAKFLRLLPRMEEPLTQLQLHRLSHIEARKDPVVDTLVTSLLAQHSYRRHPSQGPLEDLVNKILSQRKLPGNLNPARVKYPLKSRA